MGWASGYNGRVSAQDDEKRRLQEQIRQDRRLIQKAADVLGEIHRGPGLSDEHADVLAALRIRVEGKERASLEDLLTATGDVGKKDLSEALGGGDEGSKSEWPEVEEKKRDWPGL